MDEYEELKSFIKTSKESISTYRSEIKDLLKQKDSDMKTLDEKLTSKREELSDVVNDMSFFEKNVPWLKSFYNKKIKNDPKQNEKMERKSELKSDISDIVSDMYDISKHTENKLKSKEFDVEIVHSALKDSINQHIEHKLMTDDKQYQAMNEKYDSIKSFYDTVHGFVNQVHKALEQVMVSGLTTNIDLFRFYGYGFDKLRADIENIERQKREIVQQGKEYGITVKLPDNNLYLTRFMRYIPNTSTGVGDKIRMGINYAALAEAKMYLNSVYAPSKVFFDKVEDDLKTVEMAMEKKRRPIREKIRIDTGY